MNLYQREINRIRELCYANRQQLASVVAMRNYINKNFDSEINLDFLSHLQYTSKFHLLRIFKKYYGVTPGQYLINRRIEEAKIKLRSGMPVMDTCYAVGFGNPSSFSTLFKNKVGVTPVSYQKRAIFAK